MAAGQVGDGYVKSRNFGGSQFEDSQDGLLPEVAPEH